MFHIPRVNVIESDAGYSIEMLGMTGIQYRESDKSLLVHSEIGGSETPTAAIWRDHFSKWDPPYEKEPVTEVQKTEILKRICSALKWRNIQVEIHSEATGWVKGWIE